MGIVQIIADEAKILSVHLCQEEKTMVNPLESKKNEIIKECEIQLKEYMKRERVNFELALNPQGTEFQKQVWNELLNIPYGTTCSYKEIAIRIGKPKAIRAVANAIGKNPIWIIIPCHRVIGSDGSLTGYAGGLDIKEKLLQLEKAV